MAKARARHILVPTKEKCEELKTQIEAGGDFAVLSKRPFDLPIGETRWRPRRVWPGPNGAGIRYCGVQRGSRKSSWSRPNTIWIPSS